MELRHVRYFVAVAEDLHFGRAAERLHIAQPPLSRQIMQLEQEMKVQLLERNKRTVRLTPAGEAFLDKARDLLARADDAVLAAQRVASGHAGSLTVAFVGSAMFSILPDILRAFRSRYPDVDLHLNEMTTGQQVTALHDARTQVAFVRPGVVHPDIVSDVVLREDLVAALPESHRLADRNEIRLGELSAEPFILFSRQVRPSFGDQILSLCISAGFTPIAVQEALEMQTALGLVAGGLGVAVVPESVRRIAWPGVKLVRFPSPVPQTELSIAYRVDETSPILPRFHEIVREVSADASGGEAVGA
jgi:DNA-binding transcriptional LysR family regulator